jgi:hypothetical protein
MPSNNNNKSMETPWFAEDGVAVGAHRKALSLELTSPNPLALGVEILRARLATDARCGLANGTSIRSEECDQPHTLGQQQGGVESVSDARNSN